MALAQGVRRRRTRHHEGEQAGDPRRGEEGRDAIKAKEWTDEELDAKSATSKRLGLKPGPRWTPERGGWTAEQMALLGTDHDKVIAKKLGRTQRAVTTQRVKRKIPAFSGSPGGGRAWTDEELALLGTDHDEVSRGADRADAGRGEAKRAALKVPTFRDRRCREPSAHRIGK